jgi:hypothetical protein
VGLFICLLFDFRTSASSFAGTRKSVTQEIHKKNSTLICGAALHDPARIIIDALGWTINRFKHSLIDCRSYALGDAAPDRVS